MAKADIHPVTPKETLELAGVGLFDAKKDNRQIIEVVLSERNLLSLLAKLHVDGSRRTIYNGDVPEGYLLKLVAEDDTNHYSDRPAPGAMHSSTEGLVRALRSAVEEWTNKHKVVELFHKSVDDSRGDSA